VPAVGAAVADQFVVVLDGYVDVATAGTYSFNVGSDDGFSLSIDGNVLSQFPTNRAFGVTTANISLSPGLHSIQLLYWENTGGNCVELKSTLVGGGNLNNTVTKYAGGSDGNDTIDGEGGDDVLALTGDQASYNITQIGAAKYQVVDTRTGSPDGTDIITNVERIRFGNGNEIRLYGKDLPAPIPDNVLRFDLGEQNSYFDYEIVDARTRKLFDNADALNVLTADNAAQAVTATKTAIQRATGLRAYVGSKATQANFVSSGLTSRVNEMARAHAVIADTDIAASSTAYAQELAQQSAAINIQAQAELLRYDSLTIMISDTTNVSSGQPSGSNKSVDLKS